MKLSETTLVAVVWKKYCDVLRKDPLLHIYNSGETTTSAAGVVLVDAYG